MPYAVTHILVPILLVSLFRDFVLKPGKRKFPLHYVLIAGLGGVLPDIDIVFSVFLRMIGQSDWWVHKTFTHSLFFPLAFLLVALLLKPFHTKAVVCTRRGHKLHLTIISLMLAFGTFIHIILDLLFGEQAYLFYPFYLVNWGINLFSLSGLPWPNTAALIDGILLVIWIVYLELKHKISDFI